MDGHTQPQPARRAPDQSPSGRHKRTLSDLNTDLYTPRQPTLNSMRCRADRPAAPATSWRRSSRLEAPGAPEIAEPATSSGQQPDREASASGWRAVSTHLRCCRVGGYVCGRPSFVRIRSVAARRHRPPCASFTLPVSADTSTVRWVKRNRSPPVRSFLFVQGSLENLFRSTPVSDIGERLDGATN